MRGHEQSEAPPTRSPSTAYSHCPLLMRRSWAIPGSSGGRRWDAPRPRLLRVSAPAQGDHVDRKGLTPSRHHPEAGVRLKQNVLPWLSGAEDGRPDVEPLLLIGLGTAANNGFKKA